MKVKLITAAALLCIFLAGCASSELVIGSYAMQDFEGFSPPCVVLSEDGSFLFNISPLSSASPPSGTYKISGDTLSLYEGDNVSYVFKIKNGDLILDAEQSEAIPLFDGEGSVAQDGAVFEYFTYN